MSFKFFYTGTTQFENTGDLLINKVLLDLVSNYGEIYIFDENLPTKYKQKLIGGIDNIHLQSTNSGVSNNKSVLKKLLINKFSKKKFQIVILETPGHFFNNFERIPLRHYSIFLNQIFQRLLGAKRIRIGVSLGPFGTNNYIKFIAEQTLLYAAFGVRDEASLNIAKEYNFRNTFYIPDLAWAYNIKKLTKQNSNISIPSEKFIVLSFRNCLKGGRKDNAYYYTLENGINHILNKFEDYTIVLAYQVEFDRATCLELYEKFHKSYNLRLIDSSLGLDDAVNLYSKAEVVISNRLHVLLMAIKSGAFAVGLTDVNKHHKLYNIFKDEGLEDLILDHNQENLVEEFTKVLNDKKIYEQKCAKAIELNAKIISERIESLLKS